MSGSRCSQRRSTGKRPRNSSWLMARPLGSCSRVAGTMPACFAAQQLRLCGAWAATEPAISRARKGEQALHWAWGRQIAGVFGGVDLADRWRYRGQGSCLALLRKARRWWHSENFTEVAGLGRRGDDDVAGAGPFRAGCFAGFQAMPFSSPSALTAAVPSSAACCCGQGQQGQGEAGAAIFMGIFLERG